MNYFYHIFFRNDKEKVGFLYGDGKPEKEDYLLGRRIDHHIDKEEEQEQQNSSKHVLL